VVRPGLEPPSTSAVRTHLRSVSDETPTFIAIEVIAAHCDGCSSRCSNTIRTARSRTSWGYLLRRVMAPTSHESEPPRNPERFSPVHRGGWLEPSTGRDRHLSRGVHDGHRASAVAYSPPRPVRPQGIQRAAYRRGCEVRGLRQVIAHLSWHGTQDVGRAGYGRVAGGFRRAARVGAWRGGTLLG